MWLERQLIIIIWNVIGSNASRKKFNSSKNSLKQNSFQICVCVEYMCFAKKSYSIFWLLGILYTL